VDFQTVLDEINSWPAEDRLRLFHVLKESGIEDEPPMELCDELYEEVLRRAEAYKRDPSRSITLEEYAARRRNGRG
jgi:putative addiction module component (TIGR02574 family)